MMKKLYSAFLLLLLCSSLSFAQSSVHHCDVSVTDFNIDDKVKLGSFIVDVKPENLVAKAFRFPDTRLFVNASVLYMQASPYIKGSPPVEMILTLALSRKEYSATESEMRSSDVITNARARVPLKAFEVAEVETIYLGKPEAVIITFECRKQ